jgi:toxin FitB
VKRHLLGHRSYRQARCRLDAAAAEQYAIIASARERAGKPLAGFDALIAAVCRSCGAALATRNPTDFEGTGVEIINPWTPQAAES